MVEKESNTMNSEVSNQETKEGITASKGKYDHLSNEEKMELISNVPSPIIMTKAVLSR